jgi:hypothetical protein
MAKKLSVIAWFLICGLIVLNGACWGGEAAVGSAILLFVITLPIGSGVAILLTLISVAITRLNMQEIKSLNIAYFFIEYLLFSMAGYYQWFIVLPKSLHSWRNRNLKVSNGANGSKKT